MSALPKIKPCPLCGHDEHLAVYTYDGGGIHVECSTTCGYLGPACTGVRWAIRHHNQQRDETARRHIASLVSRTTTAEADFAALRAEVERKDKALEPLARVAVGAVYKNAGLAITVGDVLAARAALAPAKAGG